MLRNDPAYMDAIEACRSAGCFYCPINWHVKADEGSLTAVAWGIEPGVRALVSAPLYHSAPSSFARLALVEGACLVLAPRFDPEQTLGLIERHR